MPPGTSKVVGAADLEIVVFNLDGDIVAVNNVCAHRQQPLGDGVVRDGILTCPAHLWRYDLRTGERTDSPGWAIACYQVTIDGSSVMVEIPRPEPQLSIRDQLLEHARAWSRGR